MSLPDVRTAVTAYWNHRAPHFDGAASHTRHEQEWKVVLSAAFEANTPKDVVDLGTGTGACALIAASLGHRVRAVDGSRPMLDVGRRLASSRGLNINFIHSFIGEAAIAPHSADIVTIRNVLWTTERPDEILGLSRCILRPGGRIVVSDGLWSVSVRDRSKYPAELASRLPLHRGILEDDARKLLTAAGFQTIKSWQHLFKVAPYPGGTPFFVLSGDRPADD
jgi:ubiquinone/menaquinone biosynthesis C-methylase UbiE